MDHLTFNKGVLKTSCKCKSALIRSPKIEKQKKQPTPAEREGRWRGREGGRQIERERGGEGGGNKDVEIAHHSDLVFVKYW